MSLLILSQIPDETVLQLLHFLNLEENLKLDSLAIQRYATLLSEQSFTFAHELRSVDAKVF